ncbi:MAG: T9SS type A sorting domain-containing protein [Cytophagaceae bacterium]|nr:T9SS type A sorting domain-containing protein [Cytophagaceae bacterium]MDW8455224.1 T9SS type A sorting domain-containing protein [Cytophagaceae bacterium]
MGKYHTYAISTYQYTDDIKNVNATQLYYRLVQHDYDGTMTYSDVIFVSLNEPLLSIYPNPFDDHTVIKPSVTGEYQIKIIDLSGKVILSTSAQDEFILTNEIPSGLYYVLFSNSTFTQTFKLIKN